MHKEKSEKRCRRWYATDGNIVYVFMSPGVRDEFINRNANVRILYKREVGRMVRSDQHAKVVGISANFSHWTPADGVDF